MATTSTYTAAINGSPYTVTTTILATTGASVTASAARSTSSHPSVNRIVTSTVGLSSIYTPFSTCASFIFTLPPVGVDDILSVLNTLNQTITGIARGQYQKCLPPSFLALPKEGNTDTSTVYTNSAGTPIGVVYESFYSPAICPEIYTGVAQRVLGSTTFQTCCLPGANLTYAAGMCEDNSPHAATIINGTTTGLSSIDVVFADALTVAWESSDLSLWYDSSAPPSTLTSLQPTAGSAGSSGSGASSSGGLSTGAEIGIGVGVGVGALVAILVAVWLILRHRRSKRVPQNAMAGDPAPAYSTPVSPYTDDKQAGQMPQGHRLSEMDGYRAPAELGSSQGVGPYGGQNNYGVRHEMA